MGNRAKTEATALWQRRVKVAMPRARKLLEGTAWALLDEIGRKIIEASIDKYLEVEIAKAVAGLPKGERLDYDPMIKEAITEAFTDNFDLFTWDVEVQDELKDSEGWDDEHCFHELFKMEGV